MLEIGKEYYGFCKEKISFKMLTILTVLAYGGLIFKDAIGIDDESAQSYLAGGLIGQDRVGWNITNIFFPAYTFLPAWTGLIGIIGIVCSLLFILYTLEKNTKLEMPRFVNTIIICAIVSFPYVAKFAIFNGNMTMMAYVLFSVAGAFYVTCELIDKFDIKKYIILMCFVCSIFLFEKAYIVFFFQILFFYLCVTQINKVKRKIIDILKIIIYIFVNAIISFIIAKFIILTIQYLTNNRATGYTASYISYQFESISGFIQSIRNFLTAFIKVLTANYSIYLAGKIYLVCILVEIFIGTYFALKKRDIIIELLFLGNIFLSSSIYFITGNAYIPLRSICFNYAIFCGMTIWVSIIWMDQLKLRKMRIIFYLLCGLMILNETKAMEEVYYNKYRTYQKDRMYAETVLNSIEEECGRFEAYNKPIIFIGFADEKSNGYGEVEETSMFNWGRNESTYLEETSSRIFAFYNEMGYKLKQPVYTSLDYYYIRQMAGEMEAFPRAGCIKNTDDVIIVKLGTSLCEILNESTYEGILNDDISGNIEWFSYENNILSMGGWVAKKSSNSYNNTVSIILWGNNTAYRLRAERTVRSDITDFLDDGKNYDNSGFICTASVSEYLNYIEEGKYTIYVEINDMKNKYLYDTGKTLIIDEAK